jgi:hypothetical protein
MAREGSLFHDQEVLLPAGSVAIWGTRQRYERFDNSQISAVIRIGGVG